jgi:short-subunit dehydrogenase
LEGYFKSLRYELNEFNISVSMIEPSAFKTGIFDNSSSSLRKIDDYNTLRDKIGKFTNDLAEKAEDPSIVVDKVVKVIETDKPKFRNIVGKGTSALVNLQHFAYGILEKGVLKKLNRI